MKPVVQIRRILQLRVVLALALVAVVAIVAPELRAARRSGEAHPAVAHLAPPPPRSQPPVTDAPPRAVTVGPPVYPAGPCVPAAADPRDPYASRIVRLDDTHVEVAASLIDDVLVAPMQLAGSARFLPVLTDGAPIGVRVFAIGPTSVFAHLGLQNGDVLQAVDGFELVHVDRALEAYAALGRRPHHELTLRRAGHVLTLHYTIVARPPCGLVTLAL